MLKEIVENILVKKKREPKKNACLDVNGASLINQICMIRTYSAGVHFGKLKSRNGLECVLCDARRVHYWNGAASLSQLAVDGSSDRENCRISVPVKEILLTQAIEIIIMAKSAIDNLIKGEIWKI